MSSAATPPEPPKLLWVYEVAGRPRVRWGRVAAFLATIAAVSLASSTVVDYFTDVPTNVVVLLAPLSVAAAYVVIVAELQLQRMRTGAWRFRYSLRSILILTALAAFFFALASYGIRENQRQFAMNAELTKQLEAVIQGGKVSISNPGGRGIACQVTRASFSDDDLARVIDLASQGSTRTCELQMLFLGGTSVTNAGVCQLAARKKLIVVELPPIDLSPAAIDALAKCRLETLIIDERQLSAAQLHRLRKNLPDIRLNGRTWAQRDGK
jgi:hypothetical protein